MEECLVWQDDENMRLVNEAKTYRVPPGVALTVETTAYALLTALAHNDLLTANAAACFLSSQENYNGGFKSTQVGLMRLNGTYYVFYVFYSNSKQYLKMITLLFKHYRTLSWLWKPYQSTH